MKKLFIRTIAFNMLLGSALGAIAGTLTYYSTTGRDVTLAQVLNRKADHHIEIELDAASEQALEAPHFVLMEDRNYKVDSGYTLRDFAYAEDKDGNNISDRIVILDDGDYDPDVAGDYTVTYVVNDYDNVSAVKTINISVGDYTQNDYGFDVNSNLDTLIEFGYFEYQPLTENDDNDMELVTELTSCTSFGVLVCDEQSTDSWRCGFSASIYQITPNYVYFLSAKHCSFDYAYTYLYDYDESIIEVPTSSIHIISYYPEIDWYQDYESDVEVFAIPTNYFPIDDLMSYRQVHINWDIYDSLEAGDLCLANTQSWSGQRDIQSTLTMRDTTLCDTTVLCFGEKVLIKGQSGSPFFDRYGNFISIVSGWDYDYNWNPRDFGVHLDVIREFLLSEEYQAFYLNLEV